MTEKCFNFNCLNSVDQVCLCDSDPVFICQDHLSTHNNLIKNKEHYLYSPHINVNNDSQIYPTLKNLESECQELISLAINLIEIGSLDIQSHYFNLLKISLSIQSNLEKISHFGHYIPYHLDSYSYRQLISTNSHEIYLENLNFRLQQSRVQIQSSNQTPSNEPEYFIYFFNYNSHLIKFNIISQSFESKPRIAPLNSIFAPVLCRISNSLLFLQGGRNDDMVYYGFTYLIETESMSLVKLPEGVVRAGGAGLLHDSNIYIFGGYLKRGSRGVKLTNASCYDLKMNVWRELCQLPSPQCSTSSCLVEDLIVVSGRKNNFLHSYSISKNTFSNLNSKIEFSMVSILVKFCDKVFFLTNTDIYQADICNLEKWTVVGKACRGFANSLNYDLSTYGKYIYLSDCYGTIFQFDCELADLKVFAKLSDSV